MNIEMGVLIGYILLLNANILLENYIDKKVNKKINTFMESLGCDLNYREELIMEAITHNLLEELKPNYQDKLIPFIGFFKNIQTLYYLDQDIEEHIYYLKRCYRDILFKKKEEKEKLKEYFVSYELMGKYITVWFTYLKSLMVITDGSETFNDLSLKEQYETLYNVLKDLKKRERNIIIRQS